MGFLRDYFTFYNSFSVKYLFIAFFLSYLLLGLTLNSFNSLFAIDALGSSNYNSEFSFFSIILLYSILFLIIKVFDLSKHLRIFNNINFDKYIGKFNFNPTEINSSFMAYIFFSIFTIIYLEIYFEKNLYIVFLLLSFFILSKVYLLQVISNMDTILKDDNGGLIYLTAPVIIVDLFVILFKIVGEFGYSFDKIDLGFFFNINILSSMIFPIAIIFLLFLFKLKNPIHNKVYYNSFSHKRYSSLLFFGSLLSIIIFIVGTNLSKVELLHFLFLKEIPVIIFVWVFILRSYFIIKKKIPLIEKWHIGCGKIIGNLVFIEEERIGFFSGRKFVNYYKIKINGKISYVENNFINSILDPKVDKFTIGDKIEIYGFKYQNELIVNGSKIEIDMISPLYFKKVSGEIFKDY